MSDDLLYALRPPNETEYGVIEVLPNVTCIVHGDMNFGNLLVADAPPSPKRFTNDGERDEWWNGRQAFFRAEQLAIQKLKTTGESYNGPASSLNHRVILIDYQFTTRGPALLDFAALECSMRIRPQCVDFNDVNEILEQGKLERDIWQAAWHEGGSLEYITDKSRWESWGYWGVFSYEIMKMARRNFEDTQEYDLILDPHRPILGSKDWERLYAATCLLYILRYYLIDNFGAFDIHLPGTIDEYVDRKSQYALRLGLWMQHLLNVINGRNIGQVK